MVRGNAPDGEVQEDRNSVEEEERVEEQVQEEQEISPTLPDVEDVTTTRYGRIIRPPDRLGFK